MAAREFRIFLSGTTSEFGRARDEIASDLRARGLGVKVQRDFRQEAGTDTTLAKLDKYIRECDAVVHVAGRRSGSFPGDEEAAPYRHALPPGCDRATYTQWEFHLARHHRRRLSIYVANPAYVPDQPTATFDDPASQAAHVARLERLDRDYFDTHDRLCRLVIREDWPLLKGHQPHNLPFASLGPLFKGREADLERLHTELGRSGGAALTARAVHGLGGIGKTRLAVEYAHRHAAEHTALLFVRADTPEALKAGLAALAGPDILDLRQWDQTEEARLAAALGWLDTHPGWLLILDNVDDGAAMAAVGALLGRLSGGRVVVTARATKFPASLPTMELDTLDQAAAIAFLLERTEGRRRQEQDDAERAAELAGLVDGLAVALDQAAAHIATERISFSRYLRLWRESWDKVADWHDGDAIDYPKPFAATWLTYFAKLKLESRRLLERLSFFGPAPIPDWLLDQPVPIAGAEPEAVGAGPLAGLYAYSLATPLGADAAEPGFTIHGLVKRVVQREMTVERREAALGEAIDWMASVNTGKADDVRNWRRITPLVPHMLALTEAGETIRREAVMDLLMRLTIHFDARAQYDQAETTSRRALGLAEEAYGLDHPHVAVHLNNLASLLQATNRLAEAEPVMRRALAIDEAAYGWDHPTVATRLNNLAQLLQATNRLAEAEPLMRRALAIDEAVFGQDHPKVVTRINNLASLLAATGRIAEAQLTTRLVKFSTQDKSIQHSKVKFRNVANKIISLRTIYKRNGPFELQNKVTYINTLASDISNPRYMMLENRIIGIINGKSYHKKFADIEDFLILLNKDNIDQESIVMMGTLCQSPESRLEIGATFIDDAGEFHILNGRTIEAAQQTGTLNHPVTKIPIQEYKSRLVPVILHNE